MAAADALLRTVEEYLVSGYEVRRFEAKGPGVLTDKHFVATVARAAMAMGNLRDGGIVCIGVDDKNLAAMLPGLDPVQLAQWTRYDDVADQLARYSEPPVSFALHPLALRDGAQVVVLIVDEFDTDIHVCKKDMPGVLQRGQTYVRPRGKPQSVSVPSTTEMRELHNLAIDKGVREFVRRASAAGFLGANVQPPPSPRDIEQAQFDAELGAAWADPNPVSAPDPRTIAPGIETPAFTDVAIRPGPYDPNRLALSDLPRFISEHAVSLRGWPVPMVSYRDPVQHHENWIAQDIQPDVVTHAEAWRMFTSGQFLHRRIVATDLRDDADQLRPEDPRATGAIAVWDVLVYMVEVAELGARMATALEVDTITFDIALRHIRGRELISGDPRRRSHHTRITQATDLADSVTLSTPTLVAAPRHQGVELAQHLLRKFGANIADQTLLEWQAQILND